MYVENQLLFPSRITMHLRRVDGEAWRALVEHAAALEETHPERLAFDLMMMRLNHCLECETDCYRAMRGCLACSRQTIRRFRGGDGELGRLYQRALGDVRRYLAMQQLHAKAMAGALHRAA
jgi:hypothetical protein